MTDGGRQRQSYITSQHSSLTAASLPDWPWLISRTWCTDAWVCGNNEIILLWCAPSDRPPHLHAPAARTSQLPTSANGVSSYEWERANYRYLQNRHLSTESPKVCDVGKAPTNGGIKLGIQ